MSRGRPASPYFSSAPAPTARWIPKADLASLRSHRSALGKARLAEAIDRTHALLGLPNDYRLGIVPASDTGAMEMAMWSLLGSRPVTMLAWESFGAGWVTDVVKQLKLDAEVRTAEYGALPNLRDRSGSDSCSNGRTTVECACGADWIANDRTGLTICDATSAAFAQDVDWPKIDVGTFSWQKALGGEGAHGMIVLSPRAVERLEAGSSRPLPKIFRLTKSGKLIDGIFRGETINTPSMLAVEDWLFAVRWAESVGGLPALITRADANAAALSPGSTPRLDRASRHRPSTARTRRCEQFTTGRLEQTRPAEINRKLLSGGRPFDSGPIAMPPRACALVRRTSTRRLEALGPWLDHAWEQP